MDLPGNVIAVVEHVRGKTERVTKREFGRALVQIASAAGRESVPTPGTGGYGKLKARALSEELEGVWIKGQAGEMDIRVSRKQVKGVLRFLKRLGFEDGAEFRRSLRRVHFTRREFFERMEQALLDFKIERRILASVRGEAAQRKALAKFDSEYRKRWRARTLCAPDYVIGRCSNSSTPLLGMLSRERSSQLGPPGYVQLLEDVAPFSSEAGLGGSSTPASGGSWYRVELEQGEWQGYHWAIGAAGPKHEPLGEICALISVIEPLQEDSPYVEARDAKVCGSLPDAAVSNVLGVSFGSVESKQFLLGAL